MARARLIALLLVLATVVAYLPALRNGFVNLDDKDYVTENQIVQHGITGAGIQWAFTQSHASNWHPLTWLSHMMDCELFRLNPAGHHLVSVLLHSINAGLLFLLCLRLTRTLWPSAMVAALFAWHPLHVESVVWVAERKDVLSTTFALLALLSYVRHASDSSATTSPTRPPSRFYWFAVILFTLSLMSKPMLVTLPFVMLLLDYWPLHRSQPMAKLLIEKWPFFLLAGLSCVVTIFAQRTEAIASLTKFSLALRFENAFTAYVAYLLKTVWPAHLAAFYPMPQQIPWFAVAASVAMLAAITILTWRQIPRRPYLAVGWLWYVGTLVPVIGLVQVGDQAMADRYTYFPLIGIFLAVVWAAKDVANCLKLSARSVALPAGVALGACLLLTENQLRFWRNSETLFVHSLAVTQDNAPAHLNLGEAFQEQNRPDEAIAEYRKVLRLDPQRHEVYNNIGRILSDQGKPAEALAYCQTATTLAPHSAPSHLGLGTVLFELRRYDEALAQFSEAARLDAYNSMPHFQAARTLLKMGRDTEAVTEFHAALQRDPNNFQVLVYAARVLASDDKAEARNAAEAFTLARHAADLDGSQVIAVDTLAMACAELGRFDEAANLAQQAISQTQAAAAPDDVADMAQRLALYRQHQPWRQSFRVP